MASNTHAAVTTAIDVLGARSSEVNGSVRAVPKQEAPSPPKQSKQEAHKLQKKYRHVAAFHSKTQSSCLSHEAPVSPSFLGFRNLMVLVLIVMNLRLVVENSMKYGVLICISCHDIRRQDIMLGSILYALIPIHLLAAYIIEIVAAQQARGAVGRRKRSDAGLNAPENEKDRIAFNSTWRYIAVAHTINATLCLGITNVVVYFYIHHPGIGTLCELHAIIVWLKNCSYAFTNRDLRHAMLHPTTPSLLPELYQQCPYPQNVTFRNLAYFWWAPTLVYQPVYPRTTHIRWIFVLKRMLEVIGLSFFIWLTSAQYAAPVLRNSLDKMAVLDLPSILERLLKLSTISLVIWLAGFFALFHSFLNALAEITMFGDRNFYEDWWNSTNLQSYWSTWNKPVYHFMRRHIFSPLVGRGWSVQTASAMVFVFSGFLHELAVGVPTHNILGKSPRRPTHLLLFLANCTVQALLFWVWSFSFLSS
jgi:diacylglycerol O-acyltransferase 1